MLSQSILAAAVVGLAALPPAATRPDHAASAQATTDSDDVRLTRVRVSTGVELQVAERGPRDGEPVLFLHGYTDSWRSYSRVLGGLPAHVRAIVPTHRDTAIPIGRPAATAWPTLRPMPSPCSTRSVSPARRLSGIRWAASSRSGLPPITRVRSIRWRYRLGHQRGTPPVVELNGAVQQLTDPVPSAFVRDFQVSSASRPLPPAFLDAVVRDSEKLPARVWRDALAALLAPDADHTARPPHGQHADPLGHKDALFSRAEQDGLVRGIRGACLVVYPEVGHSPHWEDPDRFVADLREFLGQPLVPSVYLPAAPRPFARARAPCDRRSCRPRASHAGRGADGPPARPRRLAPSDHHGVAGGAAVLRPGAAPDLRVQPRRGRAIVRAGHRARCAVCDVLLGAGLRARTEHQPADGRAGEPRAHAAMASALRLRAATTPLERALIEAMAERYGKPAGAERANATPFTLRPCVGSRSSFRTTAIRRSCSPMPC